MTGRPGRPPCGEKFFICWVRWNWMYTVVRLASLHVPRLFVFVFFWGGVLGLQFPVWAVWGIFFWTCPIPRVLRNMERWKRIDCFWRGTYFMLFSRFGFSFHGSLTTISRVLEAIQVRISGSPLWRLLVILIIMRIHGCAHTGWEKIIQSKHIANVMTRQYHNNYLLESPNWSGGSLSMTSLCCCYLTSPQVGLGMM